MQYKAMLNDSDKAAGETSDLSGLP